MPFEIIRNDITKVTVDAIVNSANTRLQMGGGVCGAIFAAAGAKALQAECDAIGGCAIGEAVLTKGYNLPAKFIIHTVGPIWHGGDHNEDALLRNAYTNSLQLAKANKLESIAFPLISSGIYGYPKDKALRAAIDAISAFLLENDMLVYLVVFDSKAFELSEKLFKSVKKYIDDNYSEEHHQKDRYRNIQEFEIRECRFEEEISENYLMSMPSPAMATESCKRSFDDLVFELEETFSQRLLRLIDQKGKTDTEVYKKANIDRKLFSKIRSNPDYKPSKPTAFAFAIALELSLDETKDLLGKAGFAISHSNKFDIIVEYFIKDETYNIFEINETLFAFEQTLLGI